MSAPRKPQIEDDDDDLDDLDDVLDKFTSKPTQPAVSASSTSAGASVSSTSAPVASQSKAAEINKPTAIPDELTNDFERELAMGMESLMREIGGGLGPGRLDGKDAISEAEMTEDDKEKQRLFQAAWEAMLVEEMNGSLGGGGDDVEEYLSGLAAKEKNSAKSAGAPPGGTSDFQSTIRQNMERLREGQSNLQGESGPADPTDGLEELLRQLGGGLGEGVGEEGGESEEELQGMLESMMSQLMSKEVLYDPLKELQEKFPGYLKDNASTISSEDKKRYQAQSDCVTKIMAIFDDPSYSENNSSQNGKIVNLMTEMQSFGSPPTELMGPLPPGMGLGTDGMPQLPEGCVIC